MTSTTSGRFVNNYIPEQHQDSWNPISGYRERDLKLLEETVESIAPFVDKVGEYAAKAKRDCTKNTQLTINESAAIYLYTMGNSFFETLNGVLRAEDPSVLVPWLDFLKLFITALSKLPSVPSTIWRGVANITGSSFIENHVYTWWGVNSCSSYARIAGIFASQKGTLFCINAINGKNITEYSWNKTEEEVVLMPETRLRIKSTTFDVNGFYVVHMEECTAIPEGKHIMLSYDPSSQDIVFEVRRILQKEYIPVWPHEKEGLIDNVYRSLAEGVENAAAVCCFMTSGYQKSEYCQLELQYAHKRHKRIIPCMLSNTKVWKPSDWLEKVTREFNYIEFRSDSESYIQSKTKDLIDHIKEPPQMSQYLPLQPADQASYLCELIKYKYKRNSRIERFLNPDKPFPIEESYIDLAVVEKKEQKLHDTQHSATNISTYEAIYSVKTPIDINDIFQNCKDLEKKLLALGKAGIGKSTFCRYGAYRWAKGEIWSEYDLVILMQLRDLTENRYPRGTQYSPIDLLQTEYFSYPPLLEKDKQLLREQIGKSKVLWLLDGYDEIVQNVPAHLEHLLEQLLNNTDHILTSRSYAIALPYKLKIEIRGFTDVNIPKYVELFFDQNKDKSKETSRNMHDLLNFLKLNGSVWGMAHTPLLLELICGAWGNIDWSERKTLNVTALYDDIVEHLCRRYLEKQERTPTLKFKLMYKRDVHEECETELAVLESLAFKGMRDKSIILSPKLLEEALNEANCSLCQYPHVLNIGFLKSADYFATNTQNLTKIHHYFVHLSFQEHFTARYLVRALNNSTNSIQQSAIDFIQTHKYDDRFILVFRFLSGLLCQLKYQPSIDAFWDAIFGEPMDLVGIGHTQLIILLLEEIDTSSSFRRCTEIFNSVTKWITTAMSTQNYDIDVRLLQSLEMAPTLTNDSKIQDIFVKLLKSNDTSVREHLCLFISNLQMLEPQSDLIRLLLIQLDDHDSDLRVRACEAVGSIGEKAATNDVINRLVIALSDEDSSVRYSACSALEKMGEKVTKDAINMLAATLEDKASSVRSLTCKFLGKMGQKLPNEDVINRLVTALSDEDSVVRFSAVEALKNLGEKAATKEVIKTLVNVLSDKSSGIQASAAEALGEMGEKAATKDAINALVTALGSLSFGVSSRAYTALMKVTKKAVTNDVINILVTALCDESYFVSLSVAKVIVEISEKVATNDMINTLVPALGNKNMLVRSSVCEVLEQICKKTATEHMINRLITALSDENSNIRSSACKILGTIGEKRATNELIIKLVTALSDENSSVRCCGYEALGNMGGKAATNDVIDRLLTDLGDEDFRFRSPAHEALKNIVRKTATSDVINKLVAALCDKNYLVRSHAAEAIGEMGEKVATDGVINRLVTALRDECLIVRFNAAEALGKMGEKTPTNEIINSLVVTLENCNPFVRSHAVTALGKMGEKAANRDVMNKLVTALGDENDMVRSSAIEAFGKMVEKAANKNVIDGLVTALREGELIVRSNAAEVLGKMGEKAATRDVINGLGAALDDADYFVRSSAANALGKMGETAATNEVINRLVTALRDEYVDVRLITCEVLGKMGEKAATDDVINSLLILLEDGNPNVRSHAAETLGKTGQKIATKDVINELATALDDADYLVRSSAANALGKMGEKATNRDVVNKLVIALGDENDMVRSSVVEAFGKMVEIAANKNVIDGLVTALSNEKMIVRSVTADMLGKMGGKVATRDVINGLSVAMMDRYLTVRLNAQEALEKIAEKSPTNNVVEGLLNCLSENDIEAPFFAKCLKKALTSFSVVMQLNFDTIKKLSSCINRGQLGALHTIPADQFIKVLLKTRNSGWIPIVVDVAVMQGSVVCVVHNSVTINGRNVYVELAAPCEELCGKLIKAFENLQERLHSSTVVLSKAEEEGIMSSPISNIIQLYEGIPTPSLINAHVTAKPPRRARSGICSVS